MQGPNPTEPANYRGSYNTASKEIVDIEIAMYHTVGITVTSAMKPLLLNPTLSKEQEGGLTD